MPTNTQTAEALARWGLLAVAIVLGVLLIVGAVSAMVGAASLSEAAAHSQASGFAGALRMAHPPGSGPPDTAGLERLLSQETAHGLRYVALVSHEGEIRVEAGTSLSPIRARTDLPQRGRVQELDGRLRVVLRPPPHRDPPPPQPGSTPTDGPAMPPSAAPTDGRRTAPRAGAPPGGRPPDLLLEFEPVLRASFRGQLAGALTGAIVLVMALLGIAGWTWQLAQRARAAEAALVQQRHLASLGEMSAVMAHEIRNPLASLKGHAQLLGEFLEDGSKLQAKAARVVSDAVRLEKLTETLLDFARAGEVERRPADPAALCRSAIDAVGADHVVLHTEHAPESWPVDAMRLEQVVANLVRNAAQADPDGPIEVTLAPDGGSLQLTVRDRGAGIPPEILPTIFDPFLTTKTRGTGLGLAVSRRIAERHGGTLVAENHVDGGALFTLRLPA